MNRALIPQLQALLEHAAQQQTADRAGSPRSAHPRARRVRRGALPGSLALLASATALAATHPWSPTLGGPHRGHPTTSTSPVPSTELRLLGVLRRPQTAADRAPAVQTTLRFLVAAEQRRQDRIDQEPRSLPSRPRPGDHRLLTHPRGPHRRHRPRRLQRRLPRLPSPPRIPNEHDHRRARPATDGDYLRRAGRRTELRQRPTATAGRDTPSSQIGPGLYWFGLVPDGVHTVQIHAATGHTTSVAVHDNFFDALLGTATKPPRGATFSWLDANGHRFGVADR